MLRLPGGVSPAPGRAGTALPPPRPQHQHHPKEVMALLGSCDAGAPSVGSPPLSSGCSSQLYTPGAVAVAAPRGGCGCVTPQGPELRTLGSGRLPVRAPHLPRASLGSEGWVTPAWTAPSLLNFAVYVGVCAL